MLLSGLQLLLPSPHHWEAVVSQFVMVIREKPIVILLVVVAVVIGGCWPVSCKSDKLCLTLTGLGIWIV